MPIQDPNTVQLCIRLTPAAVRQIDSNRRGCLPRGRYLARYMHKMEPVVSAQPFIRAERVPIAIYMHKDDFLAMEARRGSQPRGQFIESNLHRLPRMNAPKGQKSKKWVGRPKV